MNHFYFSVNFGTLCISWNDAGLLTRIEWSEDHLGSCQKIGLPPLLLELVDRIRSYFWRGEPIGVIPWEKLDQSGWSNFQHEVYRTICKIPHGETRTYGWVAAHLGRSLASRAVGQALRKNLFPILIPCHRVLSTKSLGGFMGVLDPTQPELRLKRSLMDLEELYCSPPLFPFLGASSAGDLIEPSRSKGLLNS